jgi:uncharacterized protein with von Willebrand factor type A (vWA) domain
MDLVTFPFTELGPVKKVLRHLSGNPEGGANLYNKKARKVCQWIFNARQEEEASNIRKRKEREEEQQKQQQKQREEQLARKKRKMTKVDDQETTTTTTTEAIVQLDNENGTDNN